MESYERSGEWDNSQRPTRSEDQFTKSVERIHGGETVICLPWRGHWCHGTLAIVPVDWPGKMGETSSRSGFQRC